MFILYDANRKLRIFNSTDERSFLSKLLETLYAFCTQFLLISQKQTILNSTLFLYVLLGEQYFIDYDTFIN